MSEPINIIKLADITPTALIKSTSQTIKGLLVLMAVGLISFAIWKAFVKKPDPTQTQHTTITSPAKVEIDQRQIIEEKEKDVFFFGIRLWRVKMGVSLLKEIKEAVIKPMEIND